MLQDFSYHIFSAKSPFFPEEIPLRNKVYQDWYTLWSQVYQQANSGFQLTSDEFARQDLVTTILYKDKVAAIHLYSFFHIDSLPDLHTKYFHFFSEDYLHQLKKRNVKTMMSMEFLTVLPDFRKSQLGVSLGSVIAQLGSLIFSNINIDSIIAPARNDVGVNKMAYDLGFTCIAQETQQRGFVCDLIACFQGDQKKSEDIFVNKWADFLWHKKSVHYSAHSVLPLQTEKINLEMAA